MLRPHLLCLCLATPAAAEMTERQRLDLACAGWATDRFMLGIVSGKLAEMGGALDDVRATNPTARLARTMSQNLQIMRAAIAKGRAANAPVFDQVCGD